MKNLSFFLAFTATILSNTSFCQGIRMHYTEFTDSQRSAYRSALNALISGGTIDEYAGYHADPDQDGNEGNFPFPVSQQANDTDSPIHDDQDFLPWHRWFIFQFELEIKSYYPDLNIPYWDWTGASDPSGVTSETSSSPLWSNSQISSLSWADDFLDSYDATLSLARSFGGTTLPSPSEVSNVKAQSDFATFRTQLEGPTLPNLHGRPHGWVGDNTTPIQSGSMSDVLRSPRDPIFYFHHAMVDKIWQDWTELGNVSSFSDNNMPTFDGTVSGFGHVSPNSIVDSKDLGIFYSDAVNQEVTLSDYSVTNNYLSVEKFKYRYDIIVHDFEIPNNKSAEFISPQSIKIEKNFEAALGATFKMDVN